MAQQDKLLYRTVKEYTRIANQRLRSLESAGVSQQSKAYRYVKRLVFDKSNYDVADTTATGKPIFRRDLSDLNNRQLKRQLRELETFLSAKTSTVTRTKQAYEKAFKTYSHLYNDNLTFEEYTNLYDEASLVWYSNVYGSKELEKLVSENGLEKAIIIANRVKQIYEDRKKTIGIDKDISLEEIENIKKDLFRGDNDEDRFNMG